MCPAHRVETLASIQANLHEGVPTLCVSTQLIEAGVDISFGAVVRAMAGLDSVAQAAGRCNRHGERDAGAVHVVKLAGETLAMLPDIRAGHDAAERVLAECRSGAGEQAVDLSRLDLIARYFGYYFFDRRKEMDYPVGQDVAGRDDTLLNMLSENKMAANSCAIPRPLYMRQAFKTAAEAFEPLESSTRGVIVPYGSEGRDIIAKFCAAHGASAPITLLRHAQRFTVNVFPGLLKRLDAAGALHRPREAKGILCLCERYYSEEFGLCEAGTTEMEPKYG